MEVSDTDPRLLKVRGEFLRHPFRQGRDDHALTSFDALLDASH